MHAGKVSTYAGLIMSGVYSKYCLGLEIHIYRLIINNL